MVTATAENINNITQDGRKVSSEIENPIDNILIKISDIVSPGFKALNFTPNGLTTISMLLGSASLYHLYNHDLTEFTIYASFSYLFDVLDGFYARKYNMVTLQGDRYDHYKDLIMILIGIFIVYKQYGIRDHPALIVVGLVLMILGLINTGCQEKLKDQDQDQTLRILDSLTPSKQNCSYHMKYLKYFGSGTLVLVGICLIWYLDHYGCDKTQSKFIDINNFNNFNNLDGQQMTSFRDINRSITECNDWSMQHLLNPMNVYFDLNDL